MNKNLIIALIAIVLAAYVAVAVIFIAKPFSKAPTEDNNPKNTNSASTPFEQWKLTTVTTDTAKIKDSEALEYIKGYSAKELSLSKDEKEKCDFVVSGTGVNINDDYYINVNAVIKQEKGKDENGNTLYSFDVKGEYYIRYDGKQVLKKDLTKDTDEYTELKLRDNKQ